MISKKMISQKNNEFNSFLLKNDTYQFYSQSLSPESCDKIFLRDIKVRELENFAHLNYRCWFDYRFLHPVQKIHYYAYLFFTYSEKYKIHSGEYGNVGFINPFDRFLKISKANQTKLSNACMITDYYGIPYDFWIESSFDFYLSIGGKFTIDRIINHKNISYVLDKWHERFSSGLVVAKSSAYLVKNHIYNIFAEDYEDYLIQHSSELPARNFYIKTLHNDNKQLSKEKIIKTFGQEFYDSEIRI